jgi:hypothetical protein
LERLAEVLGVDSVRAFEVGDGSRDSKNAIVAASRQRQLGQRTIEHLSSACVEPCPASQGASVKARIQRAISLQLPRARGFDTAANAR